jgi:GNAT superfamily N-acetyltransferase
MDVGYFNFSSRYAQWWWDRSSFVRHWWRLYIHDSRWVPPFYPTFRRSLVPNHNPHLRRLEPDFLSIEAMPRRHVSRAGRRSSEVDFSPYGMAAFEQTVATAILLHDPRRRDRTAYLALLHCTNDAESLERLLDTAAFQLAEEGFNRLVTCSSLSPFLGSGFLQDHWDKIPPINTPYDPPYLVELIHTQLDPGVETCLYHFDIPSDLRVEMPAPPENADLLPLDPLRLADDLFPLFKAGLPELIDFPAPDPMEANFLINWVSTWPVEAWSAQVNGKEAGFILLGPDLAPALRRAKGGRSPLARLWLRLAARQTFSKGRLYFGGVLPAYRRLGIGRLLLQKALASARDYGWEQLAAGPVPVESSTARYLKKAGAFRGASYRDYSREI